MTHVSVIPRFAPLVSLLTLVLVLVSGCSSSPEDLAAEMCDCIKEEGVLGCAELSAEHRDALAGNPEASQKYAGALMRCDPRP